MKKGSLLTQTIGFSIFAILITLIMGLYSVHSPNKNISTEQFLKIHKGAGGYQILNTLHKKGFIKSTLFTKIYLRITKKTLNAGIYKISPRMSSSDIIKLLNTKQGPAIYKRISIPEGFSLKKIARRLESEKIISANIFLKYVHNNAKSDFEKQFKFLKENPLNTIEGYLFPDTYFISPSMSKKQIVQMMLMTFETKIWTLWEKNKSPKGSPKSRFNFHEVLSMASIIEKEARIQDEMPTISSVYYNRLKKRMRLQADPTVLYALGEPDKKRVLYKDLKVNNPYNTYKNGGIPPGPIASPGVAAMTASLNPKKTQYYFFVAEKNGRHVFTKTYKEHLRIQNK